MIRKQYVSGFLLVLTALIWGTAFVSQSLGMNSMGPFAFNGIRSVIASLALLPVLSFVRRRQGLPLVPDRREAPRLVRSGIICGAVLAFASAVQQLGILHSTVGKAGFITTLYIIIVPILGVFCRRRAPLQIWFCAVLAMVGAYFLCFKGEIVFQKGDWLLLGGAFLFALHIIVVDRYAPDCEVISLSCIQLMTCGLLNTGAAVLWEEMSFAGVRQGIWCLLYAAVFSSAVAYTLQIVGQKNVHPVIASLIMSLESVFAALSGWLILRQTLTLREIGGCALIFAAVILSQLRRPTGDRG